MAVGDAKRNVDERKQYVEIFGEIRRPEFIPILLELVAPSNAPQLVKSSLTALQAFDDARIGEKVVQQFARLPDETREVAATLLASRPAWATALLKAVDENSIAPEMVSETTLRKMLLHDNDGIDKLIEQHWGAVAGATTDQMRTETERLTRLLNNGSGNPKRGKPLFLKNCGKCHLLFDEGGQIGPDLTSFKRDNQERILTNVINPGLEIREGFENYIVATTDGRVLSGFLADKDNQVIVLRGVDGQNIVVRSNEIEEIVTSKVSIMPEGTLNGLNDQQIRDLFAYLRSSQPVNY